MRLLRALILALCALCAGSVRATVNNSVTQTIALGDGHTTQFAFNFIGVAPAYITVIYTDPSGNQTVLTSSQYSISLNAPVSGATWGVGGTVTYDPSGTPIPTGSSLTIARTLPLVQAISLQNQASYGQVAKSAEQAVDLLEMQIQQAQAANSRAIVANVANTASPQPLPPAAQAATKGLCFDSTGNNVIACTLAPSGAISSAMQAVVSASTLAAGRVAFGLGLAAQEGIGAGLADDGAGNLQVRFPFSTDTGNINVPASFNQTFRNAVGPLTYTLAAASTYKNGFNFWILPTNGPITLAIAAGDTISGQSSGQSAVLYPGWIVDVTTDGATNGTWAVSVYKTPATASQLPPHYIGETIKMRGTTCPTGTLPEQGQALSRTTFASLFAVIGTTWGSGDGSTTFNIPATGGTFDRNWTPGQGYDPGRVFGSYQADQLQDHVHLYKNATTQVNNITGGGTVTVNSGFVNDNTGPPGTGNHGSETRPQNYTALSCIFTGAVQ